VQPVSDWLSIPSTVVQAGSLLNSTPGVSPRLAINSNFAVVPRRHADVYFRAHELSLLPCVPAEELARYACHTQAAVGECFLSYALISSNISFTGVSFVHAGEQALWSLGNDVKQEGT